MATDAYRSEQKQKAKRRPLEKRRQRHSGHPRWAVGKLRKCVPRKNIRAIQNKAWETLAGRRGTVEVRRREISCRDERKMIANDPASQRRTRSRQPCGSNRRQSGKREVRMGRVRCGDTVFDDLGCDYWQRLCRPDVAALSRDRPVPCRLGLDCEEKCQKAEAEGKRNAPKRQGSGERS